MAEQRPTTNDFGSQAAYPTHPELLDWLTLRYSENGWDTKRLIKTIVMSATTGDPEIEARVAQYEMAYRMQTSVPELDLSDEPQRVFDRYGPESRQPGTYAANCLLARCMIERGVRCIQLFHRGRDQHKSGCCYGR